MKKGLILLAIFFLGFWASQLVMSLKPFRKTTGQKPIEITKEATSTAAISEINKEETVRVLRVIDGDTVELADGRKLRYIGIDTPELFDPRKPIECFGQEAREENKRLVEGKKVRLEKDISQTDKYGRLLRYVWAGPPTDEAGNVMVNDWLVRQGFAHASTYPPDVKYSEQFVAAEREARENNRGLWAGCATNATMQQSDKVTNTPETLGAGTSGCLIKGNISSSGEKIYHVPGCGSYEKTVIDEAKGERWFCTEAEALTAGFRKAKNCP